MAEPFSRNITDRNRELLNKAESLVYKELPGGEELETYVFHPRPLARPAGGSPAILFFFSSLWDTGTVTQFAPQCMHFAERGMVSMAFNYRVHSRHGTGPLEAMADARAAIRWVRGNAGHFKIDPQKIVAGGGSGGAHIAVMAALWEEKGKEGLAGTGAAGQEDYAESGVSCRPDALVLFSAILDVSKKGAGLDKFPDAKSAKAASPVQLRIPKDMAPAILFHSAGDRRVPVEGARKFAARMRRRRRACQLMEFASVDHSFFNFNVDSRLFDATLNAADGFLCEHGFLEGEPMVEDSGLGP